jgi:hypothetical protein
MSTIDAVVDRLLERVDAETRAALASQPVATIGEVFGVEVEVVQPGEIAGSCELAGRYDRDPPRIQVAQSASHRRMAFTALHELGHHLVGQSIEAVRALAGMVRAGERAEELVASSFAARILIPDDLCAEVIPSAGPTAAGVVALIDRSDGSKRACIARAAGLQHSDGYIVLARDGVIDFARSTGGAYPARTGDAQPADHLIRRAERGPVAASPVRLYNNHGVQSREYACDAAPIDGYVVAILLASDRPPWGPISGGLDPKPVWLTVDCDRCGRVTWGFERCNQCHQPRCAEDNDTGGRCGWCGCTPRRTLERLCQECWVWKHISQFEGDSQVCSEHV